MLPPPPPCPDPTPPSVIPAAESRNPSLLKTHPPPSQDPLPRRGKPSWLPWEGPLTLSPVEGSSGGGLALSIRRARPPQK